MPLEWSQAPMHRVLDKRTPKGYAVFPAPAGLAYPDTATVYIDIQVSSVEDYQQAPVYDISHMIEPRVYITTAIYAALRGRRY